VDLRVIPDARERASPETGARRTTNVEPYMQAFVLAVMFFLSIIGGIIYFGSRDTEYHA
jgi:hypothetical protein